MDSRSRDSFSGFWRKSDSMSRVPTRRLDSAVSVRSTELARRIYERAHLTGEFRLRSGAISNEYFDKYLFESDPAPFERDESEGCSLVAEGGTDASGEPSWFDVYDRSRARIGLVFFHEATHGAPGLLGASHWCARSPDGRCVNRTAAGISLDAEPTAGERTREAAVALLVAAHVAGVNTSA